MKIVFEVEVTVNPFKANLDDPDLETLRASLAIALEVWQQDRGRRGWGVEGFKLCGPHDAPQAAQERPARPDGYPCEECGSWFAYVAAYERHMEEEHAKAPTAEERLSAIESWLDDNAFAWRLGERLTSCEAADRVRERVEEVAERCPGPLAEC